MDTSREPSPSDARACFDNPDWVELALYQEPEPEPLLAASLRARADGNHQVRTASHLQEQAEHGRPKSAGFCHPLPFGNVPLDAVTSVTAPSSTRAGTVVCTNIRSIPSGRKASKILKCGIPGCTLDKLFDRKFELERHMRTHAPGNFPCSVYGCERNDKPYKKPDKLREHMRSVHGL